MATRLYLTNTAAGFTPTTKRGSWTVSSSAVAKSLGRRPSGAAATSGVAETSATNPTKVLLGRWISDPAVTAGALAGTIQWIIGVVESSTSADDFFHIHAFVTAGDTDTVRGTLLADYTPATGTEWTATATGRGEGAVTAASVAVSVGDRICVEVGYESRNATTTSFTGTMNYGNTGGTDLAQGGTGVTTAPGWIEFSGADGLFNSGIDTLVDTFSGGTLDPAIWPATTGTASVASGRAQIDANSYSAMYAQSSPPYFRLNGTAIFWEVPAVPVDTAAYAGFKVQSDDVAGNSLGIYHHPGPATLTFENLAGGSDASMVTVAYNATNHRWWRIRHDGTSVYLETSPDGGTYTVQRTVATAPSWTRYSDLQILAEAGSGTTANDFLKLDNINSAPAATGTATLTAASSLTAGATGISVAATNLTATSSLNTAVVNTVSAAAPLSAASTLTGAPTQGTTGATVMSAASGLATASTVVKPAATAMTAASGLTSTATTVQGSASAMSAASSLAAAATPIRPGAAAMTAATSLAAAATQTQAAVVAMSAQAGLNATASITAVAAAPMTASSTLTAAATYGAAGAAPLTATTTLAAAGVLTQVSAAALTSVSSLTADTSGNSSGTAALTAQSSLTAAGARTTFAATTMSAVSALTAAATNTGFGAVVLSANSTLAAAGTVTRVGAAASMTAASGLAADAGGAVTGTSALTAVSSLTVGGLRQGNASTVLSAVSSLLAAGAVGRTGLVAMTAASNLTAVVYTPVTARRPGVLTPGSTRNAATAGTLPYSRLAADTVRGPAYTTGG